MGRLNRSQIAAARTRLQGEQLITHRAAADLLGLGYAATLNLMTRGRAGRYLDAVHKNGEWWTSREAVERYRASETG